MNTDTAPATEAHEVWLDPMGRPAYLIHLGQAAADPEGEWYAEGPGQRPPVAYELRNVANPRLRLREVVLPLDPWSAYDAISDRLLRDGWTAPAPTAEELAVCEHGLSLSLCAGPGHYTMD